MPSEIYLWPKLTTTDIDSGLPPLPPLHSVGVKWASQWFLTTTDRRPLRVATR